jgi:hypothetical protein
VVPEITPHRLLLLLLLVLRVVLLLLVHQPQGSGRSCVML